MLSIKEIAVIAKNIMNI